MALLMNRSASSLSTSHASKSCSIDRLPQPAWGALVYRRVVDHVHEIISAVKFAVVRVSLAPPRGSFVSHRVCPTRGLQGQALLLFLSAHTLAPAQKEELSG
nr:hypothetical protein BaRGS_029177 [Batillaria attramentaria]